MGVGDTEYYNFHATFGHTFYNTPGLGEKLVESLFTFAPHNDLEKAFSIVHVVPEL